VFESLSIYLDLVEELGDPFTVFERDWPEDEEEAPEEETSESSGRHASKGPVPPDVGFAG
jgi:hypothetical protein